MRGNYQLGSGLVIILWYRDWEMTDKRNAEQWNAVACRVEHSFVLVCAGILQAVFILHVFKCYL